MVGLGVDVKGRVVGFAVWTILDYTATMASP